MSQLHLDASATQLLGEHSRLLSQILVSQSELRTAITPRAEPSSFKPYSSVSNTSPVLTLRASLPQKQCTPRCKCVCHSVREVQSPKLFRELMGTLFFGYSGLPASIRTSKPCSEVSCFGSSAFRAHFHYVFPLWFVARCLTMIIKMRYPTEISLSLTTRGFISSPGAKIFHLVLVEDIAGLKELFSKGLASPNDSFHVDGLSILDVSHSSSVHCYKSRLNSSSLLSLSLICKIYTQIRDKLGPT